MTIGKKITATCGVLTALSVALGVVMLIGLSKISSNAHAVADVSVPITNTLSEQLAAQATSIRGVLRDLELLVNGANARAPGQRQLEAPRGTKARSLNSRQGRLLTPPPSGGRPSNRSSGKSLSALQSAIGKPAGLVPKAEPARARALQVASRQESSPIPMDDDFKEF